MNSLWHRHPAVRTGDQLTVGERAADRMKNVFATWTALIAILVVMAFWMATGGLGGDVEPFILLNLCLSCIAALQCFILLIAAKRADQISSEVAIHTENNTEQLKALLEQNTELTAAVHRFRHRCHPACLWWSVESEAEMNARPLSVVPPQPAQQPQPQQIPIVPIPTLFGVVQAPDPDGTMQVVLQAQTPLGTFAFMVSPALAVQLAAQLHRFGSAGDLVIPG